MIAFRKDVMDSGKEHPSRWVSLCGRYIICEYTYWHPHGRTCGPEHKCDPYFRAYVKFNGNCLTDTRRKIPTMADAIALVREYDKSDLYPHKKL